jgi:hypothetical protein
MAINFSIPEVADCLSYLQHFEDTQSADQAKWNNIANNLPNNWGSDEVAIFKTGIEQFHSDTIKMQQTINDLHNTLHAAQQTVANTTDQSKTDMARAISETINVA